MPRRGRIEPASLHLREETAVVLNAQRELVEVEEQAEEVEELNQMTAQSAAIRAFSTIIKKRSDRTECSIARRLGRAEWS